MATETLLTTVGAGVVGGFTLTGAASVGACLRIAADGESIAPAGVGVQGGRAVYQSAGAIPVGATITSVQVNVVATVTGVGDTVDFGLRYFNPTATNSAATAFDQGAISGSYSRITGTGIPQTLTKTFTTVPTSGVAWTLADIVDSDTNNLPGFDFDVNNAAPDATELAIDQVYLIVTYSNNYWKHVNTDTGFSIESYRQAALAPGVDWVLFGSVAPVLTWWCNATNGWSVYQVNSPGPAFSACSGPTDNDGWYVSPEAYGGSIVVVNGGRPKNPRRWTDISVWAAAGTAMLGGSPAASSIFDNHMVYAAAGYTVGTDYPPIRVFDGSFDRELCRLPPTTSSTIPKAVLSMLTANNKVYVTSFDSGTTSADWRGRVFELDLASGVLTVLGTNFAAGEMPYALCWHMGRLWCGTNNGIGTVGKVYYFRPGIDTVWTFDHSLATESLGGVDSMASYGGKLYVGSDNAAASRGKVLVRDTAGAYTVSDTGVGGTAVVNNGYLSMVVFGTNLYASYWNKDTPNISIIRKFDGSSWSTVYTGSSTTLRPYIMLFVDNATLFAVGGGSALTGAIVASTDGTTWTDLTPQLFEASKTLLPVYGVEIL